MTDHFSRKLTPPLTKILKRLATGSEGQGTLLHFTYQENPLNHCDEAVTIIDRPYFIIKPFCSYGCKLHYFCSLEKHADYEQYRSYCRTAQCWEIHLF